MILACLYNFYADKFAIFGNRYKFVMQSSPMHNEAFLKKQLLERIPKNRKMFQEFIFGSSNAMKIPVSDFKESDWYSFTDFYQTPYDMANNLMFLMKETKVNSLVIFLEPEYIYISTKPYQTV